jgi:hypothetical protein
MCLVGKFISKLNHNNAGAASAGVGNSQQMLGNSTFAGEVENCNLLRTKKMVSAEGIEPSTY